MVAGDAGPAIERCLSCGSSNLPDRWHLAAPQNSAGTSRASDDARFSHSPNVAAHIHPLGRQRIRSVAPVYAAASIGCHLGWAGLERLPSVGALASAHAWRLKLHFRPIAAIGHSIHNCSMRAAIAWFLLAIAAALACFAIRLGAPVAFGAQNDMTIEDASIRAVLVFVAIITVGWWYSRRQRY